MNSKEKLVENTVLALEGKLKKEDNEKQFAPRKTLALARGKKYRTPKGNTLVITVLTYDVDTSTKQGSLYVAGRVEKDDDEDQFSCYSAEEFCDVYLNN